MRFDSDRDRGQDLPVSEAWGETYARLSAADRAAPLALDDLHLLATTAYLIGKEGDAVAVWTRAYREAVEGDEIEHAARGGFWLSHNLLLAGDEAQSRGWLVRATRLLDERGLDCVERGYLLIVEGLYALGAGDHSGSYTINLQVAQIADRFDDRDLATFALLCQGKALIELGQLAEAVTLLDEAIVAVAAGEVSPIVIGIVYCAAILACRRLMDLTRAQEWTAALSDWCASQQELVPFRGQCLVHRSEIMQMHGQWPDAMSEARRACDRLSDPRQPALALAFYQRGELHRLRGEFDQAQEAYHRASQRGMEPQPGISQLWLAQGRIRPATAAIRRVLDEAEDATIRTRLLGPFVEIMLAAPDVEAARSAADELAVLARARDQTPVHATSAYTTGTVLLAEGEAMGALATLRRAWTVWEELEMPYEAARARVHIGRACRHLQDHDTAEMHFEAARAVFHELGAAPDVSWVSGLADGGDRADGVLTSREHEVLALVAAGKTNRQIAGELFIHEKTVERHVSNVFTKLGVSNRAAATAYAYEHSLL